MSKAHETPSDGAVDAVRRMIAEHGGTMHAIARRLCSGARDADDLTQDVFLQALKSWDSFRGESSETTWLYTIAARACARMHKKRAGEPDHIASLDAPVLPFDEPLVAMVASDLDDPLAAQVVREARERLEHEIAAMPDEYRVPLILKEIVGLPIRELAAVLGLNEATARSRVHRARLRLRDAVDAAIPRDPIPAPPPAYEERTCLDLLNAKQEALDRGVPFKTDVICQRCRSVFASMDLTQQVCRDLAAQELPEGLLETLQRRVLGEQA